MAANVLQEFLVGIAYSVDKQSEANFEAGLKKAALAVGAFAVAAVAGLERVSKGLEDLYFASKRTGASVENIKALGFAVGQMGGTAAGAQASLEALASFMRSSPGANNWLNALGVQTKDAHGKALDTADVMQGLGKAPGGDAVVSGKGLCRRRRHRRANLDGPARGRGRVLARIPGDVQGLGHRRPEGRR